MTNKIIGIPFKKGHIPWNKKESIEKICPTCKNVFFVKPYRIVRTAILFCSHSCAKKGKSPVNKGKKMPFYPHTKACGRIPWNKNLKIGDKCRKKKVWLSKACKNCKKDFYSYPSEKRKYCSESCRSIYTFSEDKRKSMFVALRKQQLLKKPTSIEKKVYDELVSREIIFEKQKLIDGRFLVDAYIPSLNLVIEADGDYWHSLPRTKRNDFIKNKYLKTNGYKILRLSETEINNGTFRERLVN